MLDNVDDAFSVGNGARNFSGSIATCLQSVGQPKPLGRGAVPILEVGTIIEALRQHLGSTHDCALHCPRAAPSVGVVACTYHHWFTPLASKGGIVSCLFQVGACSGFYSLGWGSHKLPIVLGRFAGGQDVAGANRVCTHCGSVAVADELHMIFECPALQAVRQRYAPLFSTDTNTMNAFFAQQDHMQVFKFVLDCLDVITFDLCLLLDLYVIRLVGWLKHCNPGLGSGAVWRR